MKILLKLFKLIGTISALIMIYATIAGIWSFDLFDVYNFNLKLFASSIIITTISFMIAGELSENIHD